MFKYHSDLICDAIRGAQLLRLAGRKGISATAL